MIHQKERAEVTIMTPYFTGNDFFYREETVIKSRWQCGDCGLVWNMQHEAENCKKRNHATSYVKRYGGRIENNRHIGGAEYTLYSVRRDKLPSQELGAIAP